MRTSPMSPIFSIQPPRGSSAHPPNKRRRLAPLPSSVQGKVLQVSNTTLNVNVSAKTRHHRYQDPDYRHAYRVIVC
ncbi:hypothetical protein BDQ17DRAFT_906646 [Cyathus striatus]|nr:hypothetical protein BDQ17DRAFT_906646 [Cyathus striatus]